MDQIDQNATANPSSSAYVNSTGDLPGIAPGQNGIPSDSQLQAIYGDSGTPADRAQDYAQDFTTSGQEATDPTSQASILNGIWQQMGVTATTQGAKSQADAAKAAGKTIADAAIKAATQTATQAGKDTAANVATQKSDTASMIAAQNQTLNSWKEIVVRGFVVMVGVVLLAGTAWFMLRGEASSLARASA